MALSRKKPILGDGSESGGGGSDCAGGASEAAGAPDEPPPPQAANKRKPLTKVTRLTAVQAQASLVFMLALES